MDSTLADLRDLVITGLVPIIAGIVLFYANQGAQLLIVWLNTKVGTGGVDFLGAIARTVILAAEQTYGLESNEDKKAFAMKQLRLYADNIGFKISDEELDSLLEGILFQIKPQLPQ